MNGAPRRLGRKRRPAILRHARDIYEPAQQGLADRDRERAAERAHLLAAA